MNNKKSILIVLFFLSVLPAYKTVAQSNPYNEVSIASPTAASLGKYADIPVNYHTGIPQVSIPIYTVKEGPLSLPISISYHASGIKVLEVASWVGAGWSLNAGGVITRTVQGAPDERQTSNTYNQTHGHISDSGYNKYLWGPAFPTPVQLTMPTWAPIYERQEWEKFAEGKKDGEPDLFFFNFAGFSGKFYFHDDGSVVMVPEQDVKIEYSYTPGLGKSIESFTITTLDGTKYYFGKTNSTTDVDPVEITNPFNGDGGLSVGTAVSSWFLNKITSVDDFFSISLSYAAENYSYYTISTFPVLYNPTQSSTIGYKAVKNIVQGVRLSQIVFSNGKVDFTPSTAARFDLNGNTANFVDDANTEAKALSAIQVADNSGTDCRKFVFLYDYFTDNSSALPPYLLINSTTDKKRLKLISLQQQACDGSIIIPPHQFDYFTELVPRRLCFAQDHWGFINGATGNATLIPTYDASVFNTITGADRDAAWPAMRGGSLSRITYPTGGYSEFEFEQNYTWVNYSKPQSAFRFSPNAGYDGNSSAVTQYQPFTANSYRLTFTNSSQGSQALLNIYNSSNVNVKGYVLEAGRNYTEIFQLPAGTYRIVIQKLAAVSGNGTQATFEEWADVNIQKNETVGGLRIKKTTVYDGLSVANNIITNYTYEANGKSTGILYCRPAYFFPIRNNLLRDVGFENGPTCSLQGCIVCDPGVNYFQSPAGIRPMETTQGNHTGYNEVKVNQTGNGYSIYRYYGSNAWDLVTGDVAYRSMLTLPKTCDASIPNYPFTPFSHEFMRGELKYKANYNEAGQLLNDAWYYPVFQNNPRTTPALVIVPNPTTTGYLATFYTISTAKKTQTQVVENAIAPGIGYMQTSKYAYNESLYHTQVTKTTNESATGQVLETKIKYTTDFRITACDGISDCLQTYNTASATALTNFNSRKGSCGSPECRYWAWQAYMKDLSIARSNYVNCRKANYTGTTNAFNTCLINNKNAADTWLKPILDMQLKAVITPVETTNWRSGKLLSASFYKYDYAAIPATQVYLSKTLSISLPASSASFISADILSNSITKDSRYKDESVYKFLSGNPAEVTPKSGITLSYLWDYYKNFPVAQVTSGNAADIAYSSFEADGTGNLTYATAKTADVSSPSGSYCYNLASGAIQRASLTSTNAYILSYCYKTGAAATVTAGTQSNIITGSVRNGWTNKQLQFTGSTTASIAGTGFIDEVRIYPVGAQMTTYAYSPLAGMISTSDANNKATYYQFDKLGRLKNIKDQNRNITKNFFYNYGAAPSSPPVLINFNANNTTAIQFDVQLTSKTTGQVFLYVANATANAALGTVPSDIYDVFISRKSGTLTYIFGLCTFSSSGSSVTFYNVQVAAGTCNTITIN